MIAAHGLERFVSDVIIGVFGRYDQSYEWSYDWSHDGDCAGLPSVAYGSGRRLWTVDQKLGMLRDAFGSGGCVRTAMERHEVSSGQLYTWRKQAMSGELIGFAAPAPVLPQPLPCFAAVEIAEPEQPHVVAESAGQIRIELSSGIKLTVDAGVDVDALARVLSVVGR